MQALRDALKDLSKGQNASLLLARYLTRTKKGDEEKEEAQRGRDDLFQAARSAVSDEEVKTLYAKAFEARKNALSARSSSRTFETEGRLIAGLGGSNVLETGLTLNPLYGAPMIPGSSLKGLAAHYCSKAWGAEDERFRSPALDARTRPTRQAGAVYEVLFGKVPMTGKEEDAEAGYLRFYDAWLLPDSLPNSLCPDVMTPHHSGYYTGEGAPTDFDDPNPVTFLSVRGSFEVRVGCEDPDPEVRKKWEDLALQLLEETFKNCGAGGKTRSGYGRMKWVKSKEEQQAETEKAKKAETEKRNLEAGFTHKIGEELTVRCDSVNKKGNSSFTIEGMEARFDPALKVAKGTEVPARIKDIKEINRGTKAYILERVQKD
mgnify:FL=1